MSERSGAQPGQARTTATVEVQIRAIVGLGNPGPRYASTRHNIGFDVVDELARRYGGSWQAKFKGRWCKISIGTADLWLLEPETFMNLSGDSVVPFLQFFRLRVEELLVVHDELDLPFTALRLKRGGGHGGHNGLRSIIERTGSREFARLRAGIGRPVHGDVSGWVLSGYGADERPWVQGLVDEGANACESVIRDGLAATQNRVHTTSVGR